jgi:hypothetical protein
VCVTGQLEEFFGQTSASALGGPRRSGCQPGPPRLLHQLLGAQQGRQVFWNAIERGCAGVPGAVLLGALDLLPVRPDLVHVLNLQFPEDVRVPSYQLVYDVPGHLLEIEGATLFGQLAMEHYLKEQITQLLFQFMVVRRFNSINQLIDLLDGMPAQGTVVLLAVPGAAVGRAQAGHDLEQFVDGGLAFHVGQVAVTE